MGMRVCSNCVMDESDPMIKFNSQGVCDHCIGFYRDVRPHWHENKYGLELLIKQVNSIKVKAKLDEYDSILGLSGGLDSSFLLHVAVKELGLRPLVFHVDGGWNTDLAVSNISNMVDKLDLDLFVKVIDWEEMKDFQLALFKSGTPHLDLAQDHAFFATMYHYARQHNIKTILNGGNFSTECIRNPKEWIYYGTDMKFIGDVRSRFGTKDLTSYPWSSVYYHKIYLRYVKNIRVLRPLNFVRYRKEEAIKILSDEYGWRSYPQKHFESRFTKFYEGYWMPKRFGFDTRKVQFSSLIVTDQMNRDEALAALEEPSLSVNEAEQEKKFVADKLGVTLSELDGYMSLPLKNFRDYKNQEQIFDLGASILRRFGAERAIKR